jgi:hypothetical protein
MRDRSLLFVAATRTRDDLAVFWHGTRSPFLPNTWTRARGNRKSTSAGRSSSSRISFHIDHSALATAPQPSSPQGLDHPHPPCTLITCGPATGVRSLCQLRLRPPDTGSTVACGLQSGPGPRQLPRLANPLNGCSAGLAIAAGRRLPPFLGCPCRSYQAVIPDEVGAAPRSPRATASRRPTPRQAAC